ncbi:hydrocephalus-inducing protein homolog isoform X1 [Athene noctua]|uniref:hydrocephalus-inducing protein homolog isoform X1 n=1 Tax=Athene noctua TaxID=126797 RepID=UPI003EBEEE59
MKEDGQREEAAVLGVAVAAEPPPDPLEAVLDPGLQMQMERLLMEEHALEQQKAFTSGPPEATAFDQHARQRLLRAELPEYLLDFGYVVLGNTPTHVVRITNTGQFPASFRTDRRVLRDTGPFDGITMGLGILCSASPLSCLSATHSGVIFPHAVYLNAPVCTDLLPSPHPP